MQNKRNLLIMGLLMLVSLFSFAFFAYMNRRPPLIEELSVLLTEPGERIEINGRRFGDNRSLSDVFFNDRKLNLSHVESWSDNTISLMVPSFTNSTLVTVKTEYGVSNSVVLYNKNDFPQFSLAPFLPELPYIEYIDPSEGGCGTQVFVRGTNFGDNRRNSRIIVSGKKDNHLAFFETPREEDFITLGKDDYYLWSMNEISFYIPEGVESGFLYISTDRGFSNPIYFDVTQRGAESFLANTVTYQLEQQVQIDQIGAWEGNSLFLWVPLPAESARQKSISLLSENIKPYLTRENQTLYRFDELKSGSRVELNRQFTLQASELKLRVNSSEIPLSYNKERVLYKEFTSATETYPVNDRTIRNRAISASSGYVHPYEKALSIYNYLLNRLSWQNESAGQNVLTTIDGRNGNTGNYTSAFVTLLRASGIPAREVSGILLKGENLEPEMHKWVEIFFERVGWFPVDPVLGDTDGLPWEGNRDFFWGGITERHIAFSRGETFCPTLDDRGIPVKLTDSYSNQSVHEESKGNLSFYRTLWSLPRVVYNSRKLVIKGE
jgi:hypothetical protein